jgi:hypothetical protein
LESELTAQRFASHAVDAPGSIEAALMEDKETADEDD